ncbi:MAG TPA: hypothetical protein VMH87_00845 [Pseudomonadales bacterium]|nr:hypothetical protein [Pseudomonadales bacterium]
MAKEYPLIRLPTQSARMNLFDVLAIFGFLFGIFFGILLGHRFFGIIGGMTGVVIGGLLGFILGFLPGYFGREHMFREMQRSSNEQLKAKIDHPLWSFYNTLALLNLQMRGEDVQAYLPRVLSLLESDDSVTRLFGRDALALVYTPLAKQLHDLGYNPYASTEDCRAKAAQLREKIA